MKTIFPLLLITALFNNTALQAKPPKPLVSAEARQQAAASYLKDNPGHLAIYAKGFVCSSCGIGLRVHLSKISSIDKKQFKKGVLMDASKQLLIVAFLPETIPDMAAIAEAINNAGYDPAHYYIWDQGSIKVEPF